MRLINGVDCLTPIETAERLGLHPGTLANQRYMRRSPIPWIRTADGAVFYPVADVEAYAAARNQRAAA
jgi:predicted site-specific integrase-resolvase